MSGNTTCLSRLSDGMETDCPSPFLFNSIKHHVQHISDFLYDIKHAKLSQEDVATSMLKIGNSMIDIYHGNLMVFAITEEIKNRLTSTRSFACEGYLNFINEASKKYQLVTLSDGSSWTLLLGKQRNRYIHIHPSRGSSYTIRARAIALKTAIYLKAYYEERMKKEDLVLLVNEVRIGLMDEAPIKNEIYTRGIRRVLEIL